MIQQRRVKILTFCEERGNSNFKYRVIVETNDSDERFHLTMPQVDNFQNTLFKVQKEMGVENKDMLPVKYSGGEDDQGSMISTNLLLGLLLIGGSALIWRTYFGKGGNGSKSSKGGSSGGQGGGNPFGGGGGLGELMNMNKSGA